jgi:hypothetical protein
VKKRVLILFATLFVAVCAVHAQSVPVQATIPFDFVVGNSTMHAGTYTIRPTSAGGRTILLQSEDFKNAALLSPCNCASDSLKHEGELVFKVIGDRYYLWQIWTPGYDVGREFSIKRPKTELASATPIQTVSVKATSAKA